MLLHVLQYSDDEGTQSITEEQLRSELKQMKNAEQQSSRRNKRHEMEHSEVQDIQELKVTNTKADEEIEHWKIMANLHQKLVATLQTQVKTLRSDKDNLENAIALCQRSVDKRLQVLKRDRQNFEAEKG
ncbi:unnamed protein product [Peronospora effusa]|nr:unnamed protein product [Peronospora effusa]